MFLRLSTKYVLVALVICLSGVIYAQADPNSEFIDSPYRSEYNPWFKFNVFKRGYRNEPVKATLDSLEAKPRNGWNRVDSLKFAQASLKTGNIELSAYYFHALQPDYENEEEFWWNHVIVHFVNREFNTCIQLITKAEPGVIEFSRIYFLKKICQAKLRSLRDEKWYKTEGVLSWEVDSTILLLDKDSPEFREKVITPLENLRYVLESLIRHIHSDDEVIARTCLEMGIIIETYISPTQAFIAYSLARQYDKWDREIIDHVKKIKAKIIDKKYRIPIFRKYFPRIEYWRFDYQMLKEKVIYERNDTLVRTPPVLMTPEKKKEVSITPELVILVGVGIMFLLVLFFLKTRRK